MPHPAVTFWSRMVASLWTAAMAWLQIPNGLVLTEQVTDLESSMRDTSLHGTPPEEASSSPPQKKSFLSAVLDGGVRWNMHRLPKDVQKRLKVPRGRSNSKKNIAWLCEKLERRTVKFKQGSCFKVVAAIRELISEMECAEYKENQNALMLFGGDTLLVKLLLSTDRVESKGKERYERGGSLMQLQAMCVQTLQDLCYASRTCLENLCWDDDFLLFLFKSMRVRGLFSAALGLAEEMIGFRDKQLDLRIVPNFRELVDNLTDEQLTAFCRLLTLTVSGPEDYRDPIEKVSESSLLDCTKPPSRWSIAKPLTGDLQAIFSSTADSSTLSEKNHVLLLDLPGLFARLVKLLQSKKINTEISFTDFLSETLQPLLRTHPTIEDGAPAEVQTLIRLMRGGLTGARITRGAANTLEIVMDPNASPEEGPGEAEDVQREMQRTIQQQAWQYKVEILFMFCSICEGREVVRMQDQLAELGLVPVLKQLFDSLDWDAPVPTGPQESHGLHGPGCECNPEMTIKVQLLKMVHSLCDRNGDNSKNKELFVYPAKLEDANETPRMQPTQSLCSLEDSSPRSSQYEQPSSASKSPPPNTPLDVSFGTTYTTETPSPPDLSEASGSDNGDEVFTKEEASSSGASCQGAQGEASTSGQEEGLMAGIIRTLMKQTAASSFRFWLASCIEVFMRGSDPRHQHYVAQSGLMEHLVEQILKPGFQLASEYQINFDLLSEMLKFNPRMFARLNALLDGPKFDRFMEVVTEHLVDTNVFIRSLVLSLQYFKHGAPSPPYLGTSRDPREQDGAVASSSEVSSSDQALQSPQPSSYSASYHRRAALADPDSCKLELFVACNWMRLLHDLLKAVDKDDVTQDNMCVVNTSLLLFIFAHREGALLRLLQRLRACDGARALRNFRALLEHWKHYYLRQRGRDSRSIEYSTNVPFTEWLQMVQILTGPEEEPLSLTHGLT